MSFLGHISKSVKKTDNIPIGISVAPEVAIVANHRIQSIFWAKEEDLGGLMPPIHLAYLNNQAQAPMPVARIWN